MSDFINGSFGIDHPLITVGDLDAAAAKLAALGFVVTPRGRHPWGTHNRLALFPGGLLELISIGEPDAVETNEVDHQMFGTLVRDFQGRAQGISMVALHSTGLEADIGMAEARGAAVTGTIDFRRPVTLPDGTTDVAVVRLAMLTDRAHPQLSFFLCQQMKRALVEVPAWRAHPNGALRLAGLTYLDEAAGLAERRLSTIWGRPDAPQRWASAGGSVEVVTPERFAARFAGLEPSAAMLARRPAAVAVTVLVPSLEHVTTFARAATPDAIVTPERVLIPSSYLADTVVEFVAG